MPLPIRMPMGPIGNPRPRRGRRKLRRLMLPRAPPQVLHPAITCMCPVPYVHELTTHFNVVGYGYAPSLQPLHTPGPPPFSYMGRPQPSAPQMFGSASHIGSFLINSYIIRTILPFQNFTSPGTQVRRLDLRIRRHGTTARPGTITVLPVAAPWRTSSEVETTTTFPMSSAHHSCQERHHRSHRILPSRHPSRACVLDAM
jgi:hypothetical protein